MSRYDSLSVKDKYDMFMVGNMKIPYSAIKSYEFSRDGNGNPKYKVKTVCGGTYDITGTQAYEFDVTRVQEG